MNKDDKILITGATGLIGRVFCLHLAYLGYTVSGVYRSLENLHRMRKELVYYTENSIEAEKYFSKINWVQADLTECESLHESFIGHNIIIHCAGFVSFNGTSRGKINELNVEITKNVLLTATELEVKKFLHISSIAAYDEQPDRLVIDETSGLNPKKPHSEYALAKHSAEMEVWRESAEGLDVIILNPGVVLGSGAWDQSSGGLYASLLHSPLTFPGTTGFVDVRDVANAGILLLKKEIKNENYFLISENLSYQTISSTVKKYFNKKKPVLLNRSVLMAFHYLVSPFTWIMPQLRLLSSSNVDALTQKSEYSSDKIKKLGFSFISVSESLNFHLKNFKSYISSNDRE